MKISKNDPFLSDLVWVKNNSHYVGQVKYRVHLYNVCKGVRIMMPAITMFLILKSPPKIRTIWKHWVYALTFLWKVASSLWKIGHTNTSFILMLERICQKQCKWRKNWKSRQKYCLPRNNFFPDYLAYWGKTICWTFSFSLLSPLKTMYHILFNLGNKMELGTGITNLPITNETKHLLHRCKSWHLVYLTVVLRKVIQLTPPSELKAGLPLNL